MQIKYNTYWDEFDNQYALTDDELIQIKGTCVYCHNFDAWVSRDNPDVITVRELKVEFPELSQYIVDLENMCDDYYVFIPDWHLQQMEDNPNE